MSKILMSSNQNFSYSNILTFNPLDAEEGLPFPLYLDESWKWLITISLIFTIMEGTRLRIVVIKYLNSPEAKLGPINYLITIDQVLILTLYLMFIVSSVWHKIVLSKVGKKFIIRSHLNKISNTF